ncbi:unnamed protein product [Kluyveromyces dobzhanskii CBS 2104]|uniref:WGS project CCBQ000000000 data, contig 00102 n=1 Tax=Kluyveromyces dobzhanskii CBS 2104 TaxID=1427455 RepID=A0A0A8L752_9SACH|nr:unnamed protein product [Kluyveromyces dobzhanskii CBS 2104]
MFLPIISIYFLTLIVKCFRIDVEQERVIALQLREPANKKIWKRSGNFEATLNQQDYFYTVEVGLGTPPQNIKCIFDTGSSDLWVPAKTNPFCLGNEPSTNGTTQFYGVDIVPSLDCDSIGVFDPNLSTTFSTIGYNFSTQYFDGSYSDGYWAIDEVSISGKEVPNVQFAVANTSNAPAGVLGAGLPNLEAVKGYDGAPNENYDNFPQMLKNNGLIDRVLYSLFFDGVDSQSGTVLFGGVDVEKFDENLFTLPLVNIYEQIDQPAAFDVTLQGLGIRSESNCTETVISHKMAPALLDSGSTIMGAPEDVVEKIAEELGAVFSESDGLYVLSCPSSSDDRTFYFDFGELKLKVPLQDLLFLPDSGQSYCGLAVIASGDEWILGDLILKSAYIVYDLDNLEVSIGQFKASSGTSIKSIGAKGSLPKTIQSKASSWSMNGNTNASTKSVFDQPLPKKCRQSPTKTCPAKQKTVKREVSQIVYNEPILENSSTNLRPCRLLCMILAMFYSIIYLQ